MFSNRAVWPTLIRFAKFKLTDNGIELLDVYVGPEGVLTGSARLSQKTINILKNPQLDRDHQIIAIPTLVRKLPLPVRNIVGDLSNVECVLAGLDLK